MDPKEFSNPGRQYRGVALWMLNDKLEAWVRRHPERWYWLHRRWKTRPPATPPQVPDDAAATPAGAARSN